MITLEYKYLMYIDELKKRNLFIWLFRRMYKKKLNKRLELLRKQFKDGLIEREAFEIWCNLILKNI